MTKVQQVPYPGMTPVDMLRLLALILVPMLIAGGIGIQAFPLDCSRPGADIVTGERCIQSINGGEQFDMQTGRSIADPSRVVQPMEDR